MEFASMKAFRRLFKYITGDNADGVFACLSTRSFMCLLLIETSSSIQIKWFFSKEMHCKLTNTEHQSTMHIDDTVFQTYRKELRATHKNVKKK